MRYDGGFSAHSVPRVSGQHNVHHHLRQDLGHPIRQGKKTVLDGLRSLREECLRVGYSGAFLGAQLDLTTAAGEEYITFTVSYVKKSCTDITRDALATRQAFPGTHTAEDIRPWIETVRGFFTCSLLVLLIVVFAASLLFCYFVS